MFHPYILFVPINGFLYILIEYGISKGSAKKIFELIIVSSILLIIFIPGYLYFGAGQEFDYGLFLWTDSLSTGILQGLGWLTFPYTEKTPIFGMLEFFNWIFVLVGILIVLRNFKKYIFLLSLIAGMCIQIGLIILADQIKGYPFASRQLLYLLPTTLIVTGVGVVGVLRFISELSSKFSLLKEKTYQFTFVLFIIGSGLISLPRLGDYYNYPKSNAEQLTNALIQVYKPGSPVYIIPFYEEKVYRFYLLDLDSNKSNEISQASHPTNCDSLRKEDLNQHRTGFVIMPVRSSAELNCYDYLVDNGFSVISSPEINWGNTRTLFGKGY